MSQVIHIKGAREHNLKNLDLVIPRDKLVVITGLSGSGNPRWRLTPFMLKARGDMLNRYLLMHVSFWNKWANQM